jgi:flagellar FliJ protein
LRRFLFRLERLLALRRHVERQWEIKLAEATGACALLERRIAEINEAIDAGIRDRFADVAHVSYEGLLVNELYVRRLMGELDRRREELEYKKKEREEIQKQYLEHSKKRKVLDKLKEKRETEYYRDQEREEFKAADDMSSGSFIRRNRPSDDF